MMSFKLAYRNLMGAGLRTWLNVIVLSFAFVVIIWQKGIIDGWNHESRRDIIDWEDGAGQYWHQDYDPYDFFTITDSHTPVPGILQEGIDSGTIAPVLISQVTIYPQGRMQTVLIKGIDPGQKILSLPTEQLQSDINEIPVMIGTSMARNTKLNIGDFVTVRWRDINGTFDAAEAQIVGMFKANVPSIDNGQIWVPRDRLQAMLQMPGEATIIVVGEEHDNTAVYPGWIFRDHAHLLAEFDSLIKQKSFGTVVMYLILMSLAGLAIFDTQILSIFRRQKEIGTNMALGMTRGQVIRLFTLEGALHGVLAALLAAVYGIPLLSLSAIKGFSMPMEMDSYGIAASNTIFPVYSLGLVAGTTLIILITVTIVSYIPTRRISKMKPTEAIKGKLQ